MFHIVISVQNLGTNANGLESHSTFTLIIIIKRLELDVSHATWL